MKSRREKVPFDPHFFEKQVKDGNTYSMRETFMQIFHNNHWSNNESVSGSGSVPEQTRLLVKRLPLLFSELDIRVLLDIPCGDFSWMKNINIPGIRYLGCDIVDEIISENRSKYSAPDRQFKNLDMTSDSLPPADLLLCRDCFVHFSYADIFKTLKNIKKSGISFLLTTTFTEHQINEDITTGDWRPVNLEKPPFNFPAPAILLNETCTEGDLLFTDKCLALWHTGDLNVPEFD